MRITEEDIQNQEPEPYKPWGLDEKTFCTLLHLSQLTSFMAPGVGLIIPIVMWLTERDKSEMIDQHGKMVTNWIIMSTILSVVTFVLAFVFIGFFMIPLLLIACVVFPIMGAVRANEGRLWQYPFTPNFVG